MEQCIGFRWHPPLRLPTEVYGDFGVSESHRFGLSSSHWPWMRSNRTESGACFKSVIRLRLAFGKREGPFYNSFLTNTKGYSRLFSVRM